MNTVTYHACPVCGVAVRETMLGQSITLRYASHDHHGRRCAGSMRAIYGEGSFLSWVSAETGESVGEPCPGQPGDSPPRAAIL
jgi:hypothetical protein